MFSHELGELYRAPLRLATMHYIVCIGGKKLVNYILDAVTAWICERDLIGFPTAILGNL